MSDLWLTDDLDAALALIGAPRWDLLVLQVLARGELEPTLDGAVELVDAESDVRLPLVVDASLRADYRRALTARLERVRALTVGLGGQHALVPADWPLEQAVIPYLQRRSLLAS